MLTWWYKPVILSLKKLKQENHEFKAIFDSKFEASLDYLKLNKQKVIKLVQSNYKIIKSLIFYLTYQ